MALVHLHVEPGAIFGAPWSKMCHLFSLCGVIYLFIMKNLPPPLLVTSVKDGDERSALYQRFYQQFHGDGAKQAADCVVLSLNNQKL